MKNTLFALLFLFESVFAQKNIIRFDYCYFGDTDAPLEMRISPKIMQYDTILIKILNMYGDTASIYIDDQILVDNSRLVNSWDYGSSEIFDFSTHGGFELKYCPLPNKQIVMLTIINKSRKIYLETPIEIHSKIIVNGGHPDERNNTFWGITYNDNLPISISGKADSSTTSYAKFSYNDPKMRTWDSKAQLKPPFKNKTIDLNFQEMCSDTFEVFINGALLSPKNKHLKKGKIMRLKRKNSEEMAILTIKPTTQKQAIEIPIQLIHRFITIKCQYIADYRVFEYAFFYND